MIPSWENPDGLYSASEIARFDAKLLRSGECLLWSGRQRAASGHGQFGVSRDVVRQAHRVAYELAFGGIPLDMVVGQTCRVARCCEPSHLELITRSEACKRGSNPLVRSIAALKQTHCKWGHSLADAYVRKSGKRQCRECSRIANRERRARLKAAKLNE